MDRIGRAPASTRLGRPGALLAAGVAVVLGVLALGGCTSGGASGGPGAPAGTTNPPRVAPTLPPSIAGGPCLSAIDPSELCGGESAASPPPGAETLPPAQAGAPTSSAAPLASGTAGLVVTMADDGTILHLTVGQRFTVDLGVGVVWTVKVADGQVVGQIAGAPLPAGAQGLYEARAPGSTVLAASGMPRCASGPCALFRLGFSVTITVD